MTNNEVKRLKVIQVLVLACFFITTKTNYIAGIALLYANISIEGLYPKQYVARIGEGNQPKSLFIPNSVKHSYWVESILGFGMAILLAYIFWLLRNI